MLNVGDVVRLHSAMFHERLVNSYGEGTVVERTEYGIAVEFREHGRVTLSESSYERLYSDDDFKEDLI